MSINNIGIILMSLIIVIILILNIVFYKKIINDFFEPTTLYILFIILFFILPFFSDYEFNINTIFVVFCGSIFFILGYYITSKKTKSNYFKYNFIKKLKLSKFILYSLCLISFNIFVGISKLKSYNLTLIEFLKNMMIMANLAKKGGYIWMLLSFGVYAIYLTNVQRLILSYKKRKIFIVVVIAQIFFTISTFATSRFIYITNVIFIPLILYFIYVIKKPIFKIRYIFIGWLILPLMIILNEIRHGNFNNLEFSLESILKYTSDSLKGDTKPSKLLNQYIEYFDKTANYNLGKFLLYQLIALVPRAIWINKPITSSLIFYTQEIFNINAFQKETYTFTIFDTYSILSYLSLIIFSYFLGYFSKKQYNNLYISKNIYLIIFSIMYISNFINTLRGSFVEQIPFFILYFVILLMTYRIQKKIKIIK